MSWFIFIKFDNKIYVLIMSWFIFYKYLLLTYFTQYSHKNKTTSTFKKKLIVDLEYIDISPDFTLIKHD
jgi:hypothetical protein